MEPDQTYSEHVAKRILARAVELDHMRSASYSLLDLRAIAAEVGVSDAALEQAMRELQPQPVAQSTYRRMRLLLLAGAGAVVGLIGGLIDVLTYFVSSPFAMGAVLMIAGGVAVLENYHRPARGLLRFQLKNVVVWLAFAAAWKLVALVAGGAGPVATIVMLRVTVVGAMLSAVLGSLVAAVHITRFRAGSDIGASATVPLRQRIAEKLKNWIDAWANRAAIEHLANDRGTRATLVS